MVPSQPIHRRTPAVTGIRKPFTRQPTHMRHDTLNDECVSIPQNSTTSSKLPPFSSPVSTHPSPAHAIEIKTPARNDSHKAAVFSISESQNPRTSSGVPSPFLKYEVGSPFDFDVDDALDVSVDVEETPVVRREDKSEFRPRPRVQFAGVVAQMHTSPVSAEEGWKSKRRDSPVSVVELGWEHVHRKEAGKEESKGLGIMPFADFDGTYAPARAIRPQLPPRPVRSRHQPALEPQPTSFPSHNGKAMYPPPLDAKTLQALKAPPVVVNRYESGKQKDGLSHLIDRTREIYQAGPKGEGQRVWSGLKILREERRKKKQAIKQDNPSKEIGYGEVKKEANVVPPQHPATEPPAQGNAQRPLPQIQTYSQYLKDKPYPALPAEPARLYPLSPITERGSAVAAHAAQPICKGKPNIKGKESARASEISTPRSLNLPLKASASVRYDAQNVEVDTTTSGLSRFNLQPAPRSKNGPREASPSPPRVPEKTPPPLPPKDNAHSVHRKVNNSNARGVQTLAAGYATLLNVQQQKPNFERTAGKDQSSEYHSVDVSQSNEKEHKIDWMYKMGHLKVPTMPLEWTATDRDSTKRQGKLKAKIGQPRPLTGLTGEVVNVAKENGGVGGPAAARWMPPVRLGQAIIVDANKKDEEKQQKSMLRLEPHSEAKKTSKAWMEKWGEGPNELLEGTSKFFQTHTRSKSKLRGSDGSLDSFECQGVDHADHYSRLSPAQVQHPVGESSREQRHPPWVTYIKDEDTQRVPKMNLHPELLFSQLGADNDREDGPRGRRQIRNTEFYQPYGEILEQYGGDQYDESHRF